MKLSIFLQFKHFNIENLNSFKKNEGIGRNIIKISLKLTQKNR